EPFYQPTTQGDDDRWNPVVGCARGGGEPVGHFVLDHDGEGGDLPHALQDVEDERGPHVVGQVGHELPSLAFQLCLEVDVHHVEEPQVDAGRGESLFENRPQPLVHFVGDDAGTGGGEGAGQGPGAGAHLDDPVAGAHVGHFDDLADQVRIRQEVLTEALRSEEHTSELQSCENLVCRLLLEKNRRR